MRGRTPPPPSPPDVIKLNADSVDQAHAEAARLALSGMVGVWVVQVLHDDHCPAIHSSRDADCVPSCKPDFYLMSYRAHMSFMEFDAAERRARWN